MFVCPGFDSGDAICWPFLKIFLGFFIHRGFLSKSKSRHSNVFFFQKNKDVALAFRLCLCFFGFLWGLLVIFYHRHCSKAGVRSRACGCFFLNDFIGNPSVGDSEMRYFKR